MAIVDAAVMSPPTSRVPRSPVMETGPLMLPLWTVRELEAPPTVMEPDRFPVTSREVASPVTETEPVRPCPTLSRFSAAPTVRVPASVPLIRA